ncbi:hypothetical protein HY837_02895 [archaeon]|nr:hypothetical protein [archaeon]
MGEFKRGVYIDLETNKLYEILGLTRNLESLEELVLFRPVKTSHVEDNVYFFVEPIESFLKQINPDSECFRLVYVYPLG